MQSLPSTLHKALNLPSKAGPITALHIFDFDGTLVRTPSPAEGKPTYERATGQPWRGGWWGRPESLSPPVVPSPPPPGLVVESVFSELENVVSRSDVSVAVVVTGRIRPVRPAVLRILDELSAARRAAADGADGDNGETPRPLLHHDAVFTHPGGPLRTLEFKRALFQQLVTSPPLRDCPLEQLHIWEDRQEHAEVFATEFRDELKSVANIDTVVHFVPLDLP